jgi:hypothetical protein
VTAGVTVVIAGVGVSAYNGTWVVASAATSTTFTVTMPTSGLAASSGGTVSLKLDITASNGSTGPVVNLTNDHFSILGTAPIDNNVADTGFSVSGMDGGAGGDCAPAAVCNEDCENGVCSSNACN